MLQKLKSFLSDDTFYYGVLIVLVAGASFGLGRYSALEHSAQNSPEKQSNLMVTSPAPLAPAPTPTTTIPTPNSPQPAAVAGAVSGEVVASKSGTKYHLPTCPSAKTIKPANLIFFATVAAAQAAGYTAAANCPGLQ